uniref:UPF0606 protein KIAA1549 n=1 Tax=Fundulus heteroclitus TaxID=8078 RepID=A0A3Q2PHB5_FUNHE
MSSGFSWSAGIHHSNSADSVPSFSTGVLELNRTMEPEFHPSSPSATSSFSPPTGPSDFSYHVNIVGAGSAEDQDAGAQGIHLLLRPPDLLSPSLSPPIPPHSQPTLTPPPPWEQGPSLEEAWGSGDYLETLSFMVPDGEELSLATPLPSHPWDTDSGGDWVSYDHAFPSRPTLPLVSRLPLSPSSSAPNAPLHTHTVRLDSFSTWDEEYDPEDMMPLEPTEVLLPDMNSLEYYTKLLSRPSITPTTTQTYHSPPTPVPTHSGPPTEPEQKRPPQGPIPPLTPSPALTDEKSSTPPNTSQTPLTPAPPFNTTSQVPSAPPLGPPTHPVKPDRPSVITEKPAKTPTPLTRQYLCNVTKPELYLVRVVLPNQSDALKHLIYFFFLFSFLFQFLRTPSSFAFRVVSGPMIFTAISVINALRQSPRSSGPVPTVSPLYTIPDLWYQIHSVLQFVPTHVDIRACNFTERVERGLMMAYAESRRRSHEAGNITVQVSPTSWPAVGQKLPVDITFAVRDGRGYLPGSEVSEHLRKLSLVEFSFYVGFPALQIAEPFHYPELNMSHHLRATWVRTVLLGVQEQQVAERSFKARLERRLALLLEEGLLETSRRRWRRATAVGNNSLQVVRISRLSGPDRPLEVFYFVEGPGGERVPAEVTAATMNRLDLQRAAIVLGHRVQRPLAQPVETPSVPPAETQSSSIWLIVGVVVPVLLAVFIIIILYWKLCGSEKLEFQPDAINTIQQRQKLQAPSVKGFDFAKLHLGQHSKDDIMVIQEAGPLPAPMKEATPSDGGDLNTPKSKGSSTKLLFPDRLSPSDGDSLGSDQSSGRESAEESTRPVATPTEGKHHRKMPKNVVPSGSGPDELLSSSSIFDHVDRLSRGSSDGTRRQANKVQLIAMQPRPSPPAVPAPSQPSPSLTEKVNTEQVALRHKSEIEHHRNKLRQRAKRRGQCEFPSMDDIMDAFGDGPVQSEAAQRLYSSAHDHMDCILQADGIFLLFVFSPPRGRRSPRGRRPHQGPGSLPDTDRDRLLTDQSATYRKYPGLNNVAYMSDPDLPPDHGSPSPTDEVFDPAPAPPPYMPPQPSIEEARQQMHSLLDDAFALVSPSSQASGVVSSMAGYVPAGEQLQESIYSNRGKYDDPPSSSRPRPVLSFPEFSSSSIFQMPGSSLREPSAPPLLLTSPTPEYPPEDASPSAHTSASLIKAIREELRRLAQKQAAVTSYP